MTIHLGTEPGERAMSLDISLALGKELGVLSHFAQFFTNVRNARTA